MKKKSASQSAFFNLRILIGLFIVLAGVFLALLGFGAFSSVFAQGKGSQNNSSTTNQASPGTQAPDVIQMVGPVRLDQDLRSLPYVAPNAEIESARDGADRNWSRVRRFRPGKSAGAAQKPFAPGTHHAAATADV